MTLEIGKVDIATAMPTYMTSGQRHRLAEVRVLHGADGSGTVDALQVDDLTSDHLSLLAASPDPTDRVRAQILLGRLQRSITLPDGTWTVYSDYLTVYSDYLPDASGKRWRERPAIWSAHYSEEDAARWCEVWSAHWDKRRNNDYDTKYGQLDGIAVHYLRLPGAEPRMPS